MNLWPIRAAPLPTIAWTGQDRQKSALIAYKKRTLILKLSLRVAAITLTTVTSLPMMKVLFALSPVCLLLVAHGAKVNFLSLTSVLESPLMPTCDSQIRLRIYRQTNQQQTYLRDRSATCLGNVRSELL